MDSRELYSRLYAYKDLRHPTKGILNPYGAETKRDSHIVGAVKKRVDPPSRILDASCGRGHLLRSLRGLGYDVMGSEIVRDIPELQRCVVYDLSYQELRCLPKGSFDVVISSDVLEHIKPEDLELSIENLCWVSREWIIVSVGVFPAVNFPEADPELGVKDLHRTVERRQWWNRLLNRYIAVEETFNSNRSFFAYGRKK